METINSKNIFPFSFFSVLLTLVPPGIGHRNIKISRIIHLATCILNYHIKKKNSIKALAASCNCALQFFSAFCSLSVTTDLLGLGNLLFQPSHIWS